MFAVIVDHAEQAYEFPLSSETSHIVAYARVSP